MENDVVNHDRVKEWLLNKPESTARGYRNAIKYFAEFTGWTPEQMLDEREREESKRLRDRGKVASKVVEYFHWLIKEKGKAEGTAKTYCGSVAGYFKSYNMRLALDWRNDFVGTTKAVNVTEKMNARQVEKLASFAPTVRHKAVIWCMFQGLMDVSTALGLDCGHIEEEIENPPMGALLIENVRRKKKRARRFDTYIYKTALRYLRLYLQERFGEDWLEKIRSPEYYEVPLFVSNKGNRYSPEDFAQVMRKIAPQADIANSRFYHADLNPLRPAALRASGSSVLKNDGMDKDVVNYMMGHKVPYDGAYFAAERETYVKHAERVLEPKTAETSEEMEERLRAQDDKIWELDLGKKQLTEKLSVLSQYLAGYEEGMELMLEEIRTFQRETLKRMGDTPEQIEEYMKVHGSRIEDYMEKNLRARLPRS